MEHHLWRSLWCCDAFYRDALCLLHDIGTGTGSATPQGEDRFLRAWNSPRRSRRGPLAARVSRAPSGEEPESQNEADSDLDLKELALGQEHDTLREERLVDRDELRDVDHRVP